MLGILNDREVNELLSRQLIGRIGCYANKRVYVVPISYAYCDGYVYCHSMEGMKLQMMRQNPDVCFEVDDLRDVSNWKSVICWGKFEEINDEDERMKGIEILLNRMVPFTASALAHVTPEWPFVPNDIRKVRGVIFRIRIDEKSSRFEILDRKHKQHSWED